VQSESILKSSGTSWRTVNLLIQSINTCKCSITMSRTLCNTLIRGKAFAIPIVPELETA
jgi:hypothetical protein